MDERTDDPPGGEEQAPPLPVPRTGDDGKPVYDQTFFIALALRGKDAWNRWRHDNPDIVITFKDVDFHAVGGIRDFSDFRFGSGANLADAIFAHQTNFAGARFGHGADLSGVRFGNEAVFSGVSFGNGARLAGAIFGSSANFSGATFGFGADLHDSNFGDAADFSYATFGPHANFDRANFGIWVDFSGVVFGDKARFVRTEFKQGTKFNARSVDEWTHARKRLLHDSPVLRSWPRERKSAFLQPDDELRLAGAASDTFVNLSLAKAHFLGMADFSGRIFNVRCDFTDVCFDQPPVFADCDGIERIDFYGAKIRFAGSRRDRFLFGLTVVIARSTPGWTTESNTALRLRALRVLAETAKNHDLERDLYIEERRAERGILFARYWDDGRKGLPRLIGHSLWIPAIGGYWFIADSGRSFMRPLVALVVSVPLFWWAYSAALIPPTNADKLANFHGAVWAYAISNALPFVGALTLERDVKLTLLCGDRPFDAQTAKDQNVPMCVPVPGRRFQVLSLAQSIFSALCIFFAGLALRNYFKLR